MRDVIEAALDSVSLAAQAKALTIERHLDEDIEPIVGDQDRLQQVVWNLLSNAVKFTPREGRVIVRLQRRGEDEVVLTVEDTGIGIPAHFLPFVFDRFSQADPGATRRHGGLGLGMAIVRYLVELHGGTVKAESPGENQGATFTIVLPVGLVLDVATARLEPGADAATDQSIDDLPGLEDISVLVANDDPDSR
jgi:signal transduction histidine kinase